MSTNSYQIVDNQVSLHFLHKVSSSIIINQLDDITESHSTEGSDLVK